MSTVKGGGELSPLADVIEISILTSSKKDKSAAWSNANNNCGNRNNDSTPLHPLSTMIVIVGEEKSTKLKNDKLFEHEKGTMAYSLNRIEHFCDYKILLFMRQPIPLADFFGFWNL